MRVRAGYHARSTNGRKVVGRRDVLRAASALALAGCARPRSIVAGPPEPIWGVQTGDVTATSAVVWSRSDRPSRMVLEWSTSPRFERFRRIVGPVVSPESHLVGKLRIDGLPPGTRIHYRARFDDSPWEAGSFATPDPAPREPRDVLLAWSADTNGQGWGIDPSRGGMPAYNALLERSPDLFIHVGDSIYADNPIPETIALPDGGVWRNLVDPGKSHVAQTLDDFRGAHLYPRRSAEVRALSAAVPLFSVWDDHEVHNNWFPGEVLDDPAYTERRVDVLAKHAKRAFWEYAPTLRDIRGPMYREVPWGPLVSIFLLDGRTYRTPNEPAPQEGGLLGDVQAAWLLDALSASKAVWKIVACDMPIGVSVFEYGKTVKFAYDGWANENGAPMQREVELARILSGLRARRVKNVVWVTADVHYAAAHRLDPARAAFKDFDPFWELVAGPMHATAFPRKPTDDTFGTEVAWASTDGDRRGSPADGAQYFGLLRIDKRTHELDATLVDARGRDLHRMTLYPDRD
jgi:alkaline phosphatase D